MIFPRSDTLEIVETAFLPKRQVRTDILTVVFRHSSNHREWKRLVRERRKHAKLIETTDALVTGGKMFVTPAMAVELRRFAQEQDARAERNFIGAFYP